MNQVVQLVKAAIKKADEPMLVNWFTDNKNMALPQVESTRYFTFSDYRTRLKAFNELHDWHEDYLHPCFPQMLGLSQHICALSHPNSPFSLIGLVHIENEIRQYQPLTCKDLSLHCYFDNIVPHPYGVQVDIIILVSQEGARCQTVRSSYLYRLPSIDAINTTEKSELIDTQVEWSPLIEHSKLHFESGIGRRYAQISGDYNPIHLAKWSARLVGFKNVMAHGNYVLALALSKLNYNWRLPTERVAISSHFKRPIILPSTAILNATMLPLNFEKSVRFELANTSASRRKRSMMFGEVKAISDK
ncbi:MaoC/PaaZ C-terminal domain-containing protein [Alteromonas sp. BMJM2]|uniref:MaoC/PaaZ C-terminal domain-containing protein n=1 Tax=Alteromonas sp. BMJM2 TaxID=2954241 RepID=UPI0022B5632A|nr:MaoC/PaaZ C-terminal domain-containing protein [Alteromonas sp. BMJM2]